MDERNQPAGEPCDVCGEVVTKLYPGRPGQPARVDFADHNREAYRRHLSLTGQEYVMADRQITASEPDRCGTCGGRLVFGHRHEATR